MEIYTMGRGQVEAGVIDIVIGKEISKVVISISDPKSKQVNIIGSNISAIYRLRFHDIVKNEDGYICFTKKEALWIAKNVPSVVRKYNSVLVVHCEAGISRSAAVSAAFEKYFNGNDEKYFNRQHPNRLVYKLVLEALHELYDDKEAGQ